MQKTAVAVIFGQQNGLYIIIHSSLDTPQLGNGGQIVTLDAIDNYRDINIAVILRNTLGVEPYR